MPLPHINKRRFDLAPVLLSVLLLPGLLWSATGKHPARVLRMQATAFSLDGKPTSAGTVPHQGIVAADPGILPLGTRIRVSSAGAYNGVYIVTETGAKVNGRHIDFYMPTAAEAKKFGKKMVTVQIIETGAGKQDAREKDIPEAQGKATKPK